MKISYGTLLKIGGTAYILTGIGHLSAEIFLFGGDTRIRLKNYLDNYDFRIFDDSYSLYQFHLGYSVSMAVLAIFIGAICWAIRNPTSKLLLVLCIGSIVDALLGYRFFSGGPPLVLTIIAILSFLLAYWKYSKAAKSFNKPADL